MTTRLELPAPAKLNLMLHVTGRRDDGYHQLQTVFQFIDLVDRLEFSLERGGEVELDRGVAGLAAEDDLAVRAARLLQARFGVRDGVRIAIDKRIPVGGGLGGGSSDAAATLLALNRLWALGLDPEQLAAIGLELGADVPVFVHGRAAWAGGIGEELQAIDLPRPHYVVIDPKTPVSTARIFAAEELTRNCDPITIRAFLQGAGTNVCEPVVRRLYSEVAAALDWLSPQAPARMSGTGACVFAAFDSLERAEEVKSRVPEKWDAYRVRGLNLSPLQRQLELPE